MQNRKEKKDRKQMKGVSEDNVKCTNIRIIGVPEREEKEKGTENKFQDIIAEHFPNMGKEPLTQIQEVQ